jgi:hypothetical protein
LCVNAGIRDGFGLYVQPWPSAVSSNNVFGQNYLFVLNISLLLGATVASTTENPTIRQLPWILLCTSDAIARRKNRFVHNVSSFIGRVAYHGLLLTDVDPGGAVVVASSSPKTGCARDADCDLDKKFHRHNNIVSEDRVLDVYTPVLVRK